MVLAMRTDKPEAELYLLLGGKVVDEISWQAHRELANTLLNKIDEILERSSVTLSDITGIVIFTGKGSFTGLRIGTTVANSLAYSLNVPVVSAAGLDWLSIGERKAGMAEAGSLVVPKYDSEPNITTPSK